MSSAKPWKLFNKHGVIAIHDAQGAPVVQWNGFDSAEGSHREKLANAKLMHAAPEMAAALKAEIAAHVEDGACGPKSKNSNRREGLSTWCEGCTAARIALKKGGVKP